MTDDERLPAIEARAERPCVWSEGEVPDHVARYLWDAVHDRRYLLARLREAEGERGTAVRYYEGLLRESDAQRDAARADAERLAAALRDVQMYVNEPWCWCGGGGDVHGEGCEAARAALAAHDEAAR